MSDKSKKRSKKADGPVDRPFDPAILRRAQVLAPQYRLIVEEIPEGFSAIVFELPNVFGFGETLSLCYKETRELLVTMLAFMMEQGDAIPLPASEENRSEQVNIRITPYEKRMLEQEARSGGFRGVSDLVRERAVRRPSVAGSTRPASQTRRKVG